MILIFLLDVMKYWFGCKRLIFCLNQDFSDFRIGRIFFIFKIL